VVLLAFRLDRFAVSAIMIAGGTRIEPAPVLPDADTRAK
jgi:hypothetical protein